MRSRRNEAFTLVEMLTVVVILGIAAAAIVPQLGSRDDLQLSSAAHTVMGDLMYAQNLAIATQKKHYVEFSGSTYTILARDTDTSSLYTIQNPTTHDNFTVSFGSTSVNFPLVGIASTSFDGTTKTAVQFDSLGMPYSYDVTHDTATPLVNSGTITLRTTSGTYTQSVSIAADTGEPTTE